jgi:hypothetical protein
MVDLRSLISETCEVVMFQFCVAEFTIILMCQLVDLMPSCALKLLLFCFQITVIVASFDTIDPRGVSVGIGYPAISGMGMISPPRSLAGMAGMGISGDRGRDGGGSLGDPVPIANLTFYSLGCQLLRITNKKFSEC